MNRRAFVTSALAAAALGKDAAAQQPVTHVDTRSSGPVLESKVVHIATILPEGAAPGARAYVAFNGPTAQLAALATGLCTLEPGAEPHPPHRHPEEEIMIVGEGAGEFFLDGLATPVSTGDMLYVESNVLHGVRNTSQARMTFYFIKLSAHAK